jgi:hypothetical protein
MLSVLRGVEATLTEKEFGALNTPGNQLKLKIKLRRQLTHL